MSFARRRLRYVANEPSAAAQFLNFLLATGTIVSLVSCGGSDTTGVINTPSVASISIDTAPFAIERGQHKILTATAKDAKGNIVTVPFAWQSSADSIAVFGPNGRLLAQDTGIAAVTATSLGVAAPPIGVHVVWLGAAQIAAVNWTAPAAATPSTQLADSIRVVVTSRFGNPVPGSIVTFSITAGGGKVSKLKDTTNAAGRAATAWTLGPSNGLNTVAATVVDDDGNRIPWVASNPAQFSVTSFTALAVVAGDRQTGAILSALPVMPSVKLVDSLGNPRQGVPVTFTPTSGGRVTTPIVSTGADGSASPGTWTLGDAPGAQSLIVQVESAELSLSATGTGSPIHFIPSLISSGGSATCGLLVSGLVSCWGQEPLVGDAGPANTPTPTPTNGGVMFSSIDGGVSHYCGVSPGHAVYCWGINALADTSGKVTSSVQPTLLASTVAWSQVTTGSAFNCAIATDQTPYCWGNNTFGQLGDRDTVTSFVPVPVSGGFSFSSVAAGSAHACGLTVDHAAFCWGLNANGELGDGTTSSRVAPTVLASALTFQSIGAGDAWTCGLTIDGKAYCWGSVAGVSSAQTTPQTYANTPTFTSLSVGGAHACALTADGTAYCWGSNNFGQVGDSSLVTRAAPTAVFGGFKFESISAGEAHTCGQILDGSVLCWGQNRAGELGNNTAAFQVTPRFIVLGVNP